VLCCAVLCCAVLCCAVLCCAVLCCAVLCLELLFLLLLLLLQVAVCFLVWLKLLLCGAAGYEMDLRGKSSPDEDTHFACFFGGTIEAPTARKQNFRYTRVNILTMRDPQHS
jgi:hypothetical protein